MNSNPNSLDEVSEVGELLISRDRAAEILGIKRRTVDRLVASNELRGKVYIGGRSLLRATEVRKYMDQLPTERKK